MKWQMLKDCNCFDDLFSEKINKTLPGYLKQIYEFFGLWVMIIGFFYN